MSCINSMRCIGIVQCPSQRCVKHGHASARSVSALFHDAWHTVTQVDSRFWQTMYTLLLRPGRLTHKYLAERRACYLPPVRVYLVLSVLFFAFGSGGPRGKFEPARRCRTLIRVRSLTHACKTNGRGLCIHDISQHHVARDAHHLFPLRVTACQLRASLTDPGEQGTRLGAHSP